MCVISLGMSYGIVCDIDRKALRKCGYIVRKAFR
jgi:hypothetical protein